MTIQDYEAIYLANLDYDGDEAKTRAALGALRAIRLLRAQGMTSSGSSLSYANIDIEIDVLQKALQQFNRASFTRGRAVMS